MNTFKPNWTNESVICILILSGIIFFSSCTDNKAIASPIVEDAKEAIRKTSAGNKNTIITNDSNEVVSKYDITKFEKSILSKELLEISGLTIDRDNKNLYAINDEKAILFKLDQKGEILEKFDFGKKGDYEGLEMVGDLVYILKSNGKIISFDVSTSKKIKTYNNPLTAINDAEGLGYDPKTNSLIIACKGNPNIKSSINLKKTKSVYAYNLITELFNQTPMINITDKAIKNYLEKKLQNTDSKKKIKKLLNRAVDFSPSAIAVHPIEDYFYLLSTVGKTIIVVDRDSSIKNIYFLDDSAYIQPEGICFDAKGNMFISNEGKGLKSNILRLSY